VAIDKDGYPAGSSPSPDAEAPATPPAHAPGPPAPGPLARPTRVGRLDQLKRLIQAIRDSDETAAQDAVIRLSQSNRLFAPAALAVGAVAMLFSGLKLLFTNWRLTLVQVLPAMWIWAALFDLKLHVKAHLLRGGTTFYVLRGPVTILLVLAVAAITAASFYLNAVFALAIARPGRPEIRPALHEARSHLRIILGWGGAVGICLGLATIVVTRWGLWWFAISLSIVIAVMMICYVAVPARIVGVRPTHSRRDKLAAGIVGGAIGALVCAPGYLLGRLGIVLLGSHRLFALGVILLIIGLILQAGTTSAVKTVKVSAKLIAGQPVGTGDQAEPPASAATGTGTG
jgi:hypothetical protein